MIKQAWIAGKWKDILFILLPPFITLFVIALFPSLFYESRNHLIAWLVLILLIDVSHVYCTLFRTYFDKEALKTRKSLLINAPFFSLIGSVLAYSYSPHLFWRILAYLAVFHFVRQQYGFMRLYSRYESGKYKLIDTITIYVLTLYPIIFWHLNTDRNFNWFVKDDFLHFNIPGAVTFFTSIYFLTICTYVIKEAIMYSRNRSFNIPKNLVILGTGLSWYFGIVYYNGDLIFTSLNVVAHGIPYMALTWFYGKKSIARESSSLVLNTVFLKRLGILAFLGIIVLLAFFEEGLWDAMIWNEHKELFSGFYVLPKADSMMLNFLIPLLSLPQVTHYVLDAYIWRMKKGDVRHL